MLRKKQNGVRRIRVTRVGVRVIVSYRMVGDVCSEKMTDGRSQEDIPSTETVSAKALGQKIDCIVQGGRSRESGRGTQIMQSFRGHGKDLTCSLNEMGASRDLRAEE